MISTFLSINELKDLLSKIVGEEIASINKAIEGSIKKKQQYEKNIFSLAEAANYLALSPHTVRKYAKSGKIKRILSDIRGYRFLRTELDRFSSDYRK
jgi:excisionase family DNA binding protein